MKTFYYIFLFTFLSININSQITFEKGYIITNDGNKEEVLIKNQDWLNNPVEFIYKIGSEPSEKKGTIQNVKEFGVNGYNRLVSYKGDIDYSSNNIAALSIKKSPENVYKEIFLYEIIAGKVNLYSYTDKNITKFFYSTEGNREINPLIYKQYYFEGDVSKIATNEEYKNTLKSLFSDNPDVLNKIDRTRYTNEDLKKIFSLYNGVGINTNDKNRVKGQINLALRPGIAFSSFKFNSSSLGSNSTAKLPSKASFRFGVELEYLLPFNKNKWAVIFEPNYYSYKSEAKFFNDTYNGIIDYSVIELPIGIRHYMFLNNDSKIFINVQAVPFKIVGNKSLFTKEFVNINSKSEFSLDKTNQFYGTFGVGYSYRNYMIEFRASTSNNLLNSYELWNSNFSNIAIVFGYQIF
ncbi:hypothetical protein [Epilithonimonas arachidiradicis]|uniref:Outer membrane protein with beta-barrel domain n=1 Tax=Epilithonimonas arachidiradicis TaxID=1617282 RepID=A0A420DCT9_9FLAO|nr:hypothetical protein [Epilithonimonas arachidiradicis]RKE89705.1 hypothetical protein BXY58_0278 [Epilithonimonas arachidiradicis]GGG44644.1 hypothetical protein GCM10007332_02650 [Epilithonimonas arachidiradicis]